MSFTVVWTERALRDMRRLDRQVAQRVGRGIERYAGTEQGDVRRLQAAEPPEWRLRVGEYRVRFHLDHANSSVEILRVLPRGRAYRD